MRLCFYCCKPNADKFVTGIRNSRIRVHAECIAPLKAQIKEQIAEVRK